MELVIFMIGDVGFFDGNVRFQGVECYGLVEFGGFDLNDQVFFFGKMSVFYCDGMQVLGNIYVFSFFEVVGLKIGKIDFLCIVVEIVGKG